MPACRLLRFAALALCASALGGCVFFEGPVSRNLEKSPNFKSGYSDGCATASSRSANFRDEDKSYRDNALFKTDKAYRAGWSAGVTACRPVVGNEDPRSGPIPDPYPRY